MQRLAELCIRRPVFASMIVLSIVVIGAASYFQLALDKHPQVELPTIAVRTAAAGSFPGGSGDLASYNPSKKLSIRLKAFQRTALRLGTGHIQRHHHLQPESGHRNGRAGRARSRRRGGSKSSAGRSSSGRFQIRQRSVPIALDRAYQQPSHPRADRNRRQGRQGTGRAQPRCRRSPDQWRARTRRQCLDRSGPAHRLSGSPSTPCATPSCARTPMFLAGNVTSGGNEQTMRTMGRMVYRSRLQ